MFSDLSWYFGSRRKLRIDQKPLSTWERLESRMMLSVSPISAALLHSADTSAATVLPAAQPALATAAVASTSLSLGHNWHSVSVTNPGGNFEISFDVTPSQQVSETSVGLAEGAPKTYSDLAANVLFNANNKIVARNGGKYESHTSTTYTAGKTYLVTFDVDSSTKTYDVYVTPAGGSKITLGTGYSFRSSSFDGSSLNSLGGFTAKGSAAVSNVTVTSDALPAAKKKKNTGGGSQTTTGSTSQPSASNTGPTDSSILVKHGSMTITTPGTVLKNIAVDGTIYIEAADVTIENFTINAEGGRYGIQVVNSNGNHNSVTASDGTITNAAWGAIFGNNWTADRLNIHDMGSDATDGGGNNLLENSYIYDIGSAPVAHADGFQANNGTNITIKGNFFDIPYGQSGYKVNSCIFLNEELGSQNPQDLYGTVISGNWFNGGNYAVYAINQADTTISNNVFGPGEQWGDVYNPSGFPKPSESGNTDVNSI